MSEEELQLLSDTAKVSKGIHSSDTSIVEAVLSAQTPVDRYQTVKWVTDSISRSIDTRGLDRVMRNRLRDRLSTLRVVFGQITNRECEMATIQRMPEGYQKYQATMAAMGKDPLTFHEWEELQEELQQDAR